MQFKHYPQRPESLTAEFAAEKFQELVDRIPSAEENESPYQWLELYKDWNELKSYLSSEMSRLSYQHSKDTQNEDVERQEKYLREKVYPASDAGNEALLNAFLESRHRDAIGERYGTYLLRSLKTAQEPSATINTELRVKTGDLVHQYEKIVSMGEVELLGKSVTLSVARSMQASQDHDTRKAAFEAYRKWFLEHHDQLAKIYDELVKVRTAMAKNLKHENYIRLGYLNLARTDYGPAEAKTFRESIKKYAVPLQQKLYAKQAKELGTDTLKPWDVAYFPSLSLPSGIAPVETQITKAQTVFDKLSPRLGGHFRRMRDEGLIDLENRKGKRAGAFCTSFPDEGKVAILCNSTGDEDDVSTLMHEMGHAFQGWESQPIESIDLQWPTLDAAEVFSMGMEYLSMPHMTEFFSPEHAEKFRKSRWKQGIDLLSYIALVDEFQHWVYENPDASIDERDEAWVRIWDEYKPGIDFSGVEEYKWARWYAQGHIFAAPFYYIDYGIAETGAMQIALLDTENHTKALETYIEMCTNGGTKSLLEIFESAGLRSPFDESLMRDLMILAEKELDLKG